MIIAGPCSAESPEQLFNTCKSLSEQGVHMFRAGVWKPRTRPGNFEGMGEAAFGWIRETRKKFGIPFCIEVANPDHVDLALKNEIDVLWVGARTSVNPFVVQEIAEALRGVNIPIMVKNPVNPDLELWIGAIERFLKTGNSRVGAIHRGFSMARSHPYRNMPRWEIPIELKRRFPDLPLICDPSHISGSKTWLQRIAQHALDLNYHGLMIEVHHKPESALSDAQQQITPYEFSMLIQSLKLRSESINDPELFSSLEAFRDAIDLLDAEIIELLSRRMEIAREIGQYKKEHNIKIFQLERWIKVFNSRTGWGEQGLLGAEFINELLQAIHKESIAQQNLIIQRNEEPLPVLDIKNLKNQAVPD
jgi:chorismate mutase